MAKKTGVRSVQHNGKFYLLVIDELVIRTFRTIEEVESYFNAVNQREHFQDLNAALDKLKS